jgi:RNA polymerase sigma factor (sigma-70 family)
MKPDPADHLRIIHRVINQMGITGDMAEEAYSESLVIITQASQSFDPNKNVPVANWLAKNIHWSLKRWLWQQHRQQNVFKYIQDNQYAKEDANYMEIHTQLSETVAKAKEILTKEEYFCVMAKAFGYKGKELAKILNTSEVQISRIRQMAIKKLKKL